MGTPDFSVPVLRGLKEAGHEICAVVTQPDKPKGRGKKMQFSPVKECAISYGLTVYQPKKVKEDSFIEQIKEIKPDAIIVVAFGQILPQVFLDIPKYGCINVHASLLPRWRGAAPIQYAILCGDKESGVTIMQMDAGIDTGDILLSQKVILDKKETAGSLHDKLSTIGADLLLKTLEGLELGKIIPQKQEESLSCYAGMLTKELGNIDFSKSAEEIERLIRGLNPWPSAYTIWNKKTLKIWKAEVKKEQKEEQEERKQPGTILEVTKDCFDIQTGDGILVVKEVQLEGKKRMDTASFLRGYPLLKGMLL